MNVARTFLQQRSVTELRDVLISFVGSAVEAANIWDGLHIRDVIV
jgi:hypothetical protein